MGILDKTKQTLANAKNAVTPKFMKKNNEPLSPQQVRENSVTEYETALTKCPLIIENSGAVFNQLLAIGLDVVLPRPVVVIRSLKTDHKETDGGKTLDVFNFRKLLDKYENNFIARINLSNFEGYSITTLRKDKTALAKIAFDDNNGVVTLSDDAVFITIKKEI